MLTYVFGIIAAAGVLAAAVGQDGGRLCVHRLRLGPVRHAGQGRLEIFLLAPRS